MLAFLVQRISQAFLVMFVISMIAFAIQDGLGDPLQELVGMSVSLEERDAIREDMGLNDPIYVQYARFAGNALQGDLGISYFYGKPTLQVIAEHLPATLELVIGATLIIMVFSVPIGVYAAIRPQAFLSKFFMGISTVGISIPVFLTAIVLIQLFSIGVAIEVFPTDTGWGAWLNGALSTDGGLPSYGRGDELTHLFGTWNSGFFSSNGLWHLVLPCVSLASIMLPLFIRLIRAEMLEVLQSDYIRYARAKGLSSGRINFLHALKNTMLPVITVGGVQLGIMVAYTILTETVFQWPGMGLMFLEAITRSDIPLIVAYLMVVGLVFVITNTIVDLIYGLVNPTVKLTGKKSMMTATVSRWARVRDSFIWYSFKRDKVAIISFIVLLAMVLSAIFAPLLAPTDPYDLAQIDIMNSELPPLGMSGADEAFPLGTDAQGRDMLSTILYGTQVSLMIGFGAVILQAVLGILFGLLAGYMGGRVDAILMRIADVQLSFSTLMVAIIVGAVFKASFGSLMFGEIAIYMLILIIGLAEWPQIARTVRASVLAEKKKEYVDAAKVMGFRTNRIMFRHILPNTLSPIFVIGTVQIANAIISEAALSFLGLGMPETQPSLGSLIKSGFDYIQSGSWWITLLPGLVLVVLVLVINLLGDWLRDVMNPRLYKG